MELPYGVALGEVLAALGGATTRFGRGWRAEGDPAGRAAGRLPAGAAGRGAGARARGVRRARCADRRGRDRVRGRGRELARAQRDVRGVPRGRVVRALHDVPPRQPAHDRDLRARARGRGAARGPPQPWSCSARRCSTRTACTARPAPTIMRNTLRFFEDEFEAYLAAADPRLEGRGFVRFRVVDHDDPRLAAAQAGLPGRGDPRIAGRRLHARRADVRALRGLPRAGAAGHRARGPGGDRGGAGDQLGPARRARRGTARRPCGRAVEKRREALDWGSPREARAP